ncbi:MAG: hypothetical protein ACXADU_18785 [Promethearchaeota archaeon]
MVKKLNQMKFVEKIFLSMIIGAFITLIISLILYLNNIKLGLNYGIFFSIIFSIGLFTLVLYEKSIENKKNILIIKIAGLFAFIGIFGIFTFLFSTNIFGIYGIFLFLIILTMIAINENKLIFTIIGLIGIFILLLSIEIIGVLE